jgi:hypothetical protein
VPADDKKNARLIISEVFLETLRGLKLSFPKVPDDQRKELLAMRRLLAK